MEFEELDDKIELLSNTEKKFALRQLSKWYREKFLEKEFNLNTREDVLSAYVDEKIENALRLLEDLISIEIF